jgi:3-phosphoshikimate 1-carboxyvinyltransferase
MAGMEEDGEARARGESTPRRTGLVVGVSRDSRVAGDVALPASKSIAQRRLLLAAAAHGRTRLAGLPRGGDVDAARTLAARLATGVRQLAPAALEIEGAPPGPHRGFAPRVPLEVGESGTLARLATALLALAAHAGARARIEARGTLLARASSPLFDALRAAGAGIEHHALRDGWPCSTRAIGPPSTVRLLDPISSQEVSALLFALACWPGEGLLEVRGRIPSLSYARLSTRELARFGVVVEAREVDSSASSWLVHGPLRAPDSPLPTEPDASAAAVALALGALGVGEVRTALGRDSSQGDARIVEHLRAFGARAAWIDGGSACAGVDLVGATLDLEDTPDLAPVLAAVAIVAALRHGASSDLRGLAALNRKESRRLDELAQFARRAGCSVAVHGDARLEIGPGGPPPAELVLDARGDHRLAFAGALLGSALPGVLVAGAECVAKSWPGFWRDIADAGAVLHGPDADLASTRRLS